jgi:Ner family transcriptional regulator
MDRVWDRHDILAEVRRRGRTLAQLARAAGLDPSSCYHALRVPLPAGEQAIASFLGVPAETLFAYRRARSTSPGQDTPAQGESSRLKSAAVRTGAAR